MLSAAFALLLLEAPALAAAYEWHFTADPKQCSDLTIQVQDGGSPPYRALLIPYGSSPFSNNTEVRRIMDVPFDGDSTSVTFRLNYPADSQFLTVVSDSTGFASGGTSVGTKVTSSDDTSCYNASASVEPLFYYSIDPVNQLVQCQATRIWWDPSTVEGDTIFLGIISGGESFVIPKGTVTQQTGTGTGFSWIPNMRGGTEFTLVGGDARGNGTAGSSTSLIGGGTSNNNTCLDDSSPSSTAGTPAGGATSTTTSSGSSGSDDGNGSDVGAIVGGVVGGVVGLLALILALLFWRRRQRQQHIKEKPVDLLNTDEGDERPARSELPQYYQPEPFLVPAASTTAGESDAFLDDDGRPMSYFGSRSDTPDLMSAGASTAAGRKGGAPRQLRPVNIIQHDDAGPSSSARPDEEPETIELPPAYYHIQPSNAATPASEQPPARSS